MGRSVITQQYSSVTFVPLPFHSGKEKFSAFEKFCYFISLSVFKIACLGEYLRRVLFCFALDFLLRAQHSADHVPSVSASILHGAKLCLRS